MIEIYNLSDIEKIKNINIHNSILLTRKEYFDDLKENGFTAKETGPIVVFDSIDELKENRIEGETFIIFGLNDKENNFLKMFEVITFDKINNVYSIVVIINNDFGVEIVFDKSIYNMLEDEYKNIIDDNIGTIFDENGQTNKGL